MHPFLTDFPGIGGSIKHRAEDFFVQELSLYEPVGRGEHVYCEIQKIGLTTFDAIHRISAALGVSPREVGYAGMKDARSVSRQVLSIRGATPAAVMALRLDGINVQWAALHENKLRLGHLRGNRFAVKVRDVNPAEVIKLPPVLEIIRRRGMPNYFGEQRFGRRGNNDQLGAAVLRGDDRRILGLLLGGPDPKLDDPQTQAARAAFDAQDLATSMKHWPRRSGMERRVLARLMKTHKPSAAVRSIDEKLLRLWVSALQSQLFNDVLAKRIGSIDRLLDGDWAYKHENGACFHVEEAAIEQPRCDAFEISPTGPLAGYRMSMPSKEALAIEQEVLAGSGLTPEDFRAAGRLKVKGARRPLRVRPEYLQVASGVDEHGAFVTLAFTLPAGSFATELLREIMKPQLHPTPTEPAPDPSPEASGDQDHPET